MFGMDVTTGDDEKDPEPKSLDKLWFGPAELLKTGDTPLVAFALPLSWPPPVLLALEVLELVRLCLRTRDSFLNSVRHLFSREEGPGGGGGGGAISLGPVARHSIQSGPRCRQQIETERNRANNALKDSTE